MSAERTADPGLANPGLAAILRRRAVRWVGGFLLWSALGLFETALHLAYHGPEAAAAGSWPETFFRILPRWYLWGLLTPIVIGLARRFPLHPRVARPLFLVHLPAGLALTTVHAVTWLALRYTIFYPPEQAVAYLAYARRVFPPFFALDFMAFWAILGAYFALYYVGRFREREVQRARLELEASRLETRLTRARLHVLTTQLQPHFLFNTLNAVAELIPTRPAVAEQMVVRLGDLLRRLTDIGSTDEIPLREELEVVRAYLEIERLRYGDRLTTRLDLAPEALEVRVPTLCVQPLVENAVRHGLAPVGRAGTLEIAARREDGWLLVEVRDDGRGLAFEPDEEGVGLGNTRRRLQKLYGSEAALELSPRPGGGTVARLRLPAGGTADARSG